MRKEERHKIVPRFRFPEFRNSLDWKETLIGEIANVTTGGTPESTNSKYWNGEIPWMNSGELNQKRVYSVANRITLLGLKESSTRLIPPHCVLIGLAGQGKTRGTAAINYIQLCINQSIASIHPNKEVFNSEFLYQRIDSMYEELRALSTGEGGRGGLNLQIIKSLKLFLPLSEEQQKIADCLYSLDELITAQSQKFEVLKAHKKGMMQQLFPVEGETVPKLRFAEFRDSGEWEEKTLKDVCRMQAGKFVSASEINEKQSKDLYPCYGGNGLRGYTKSYTHLGKFSLIGRQGALCGNVTLVDGKFHATEHAVVVTPESGVDTSWLFYMLTHLNLNQYATRQAQPGLSVDNLEKVEIKIPDSEKEQEKISNCLSSLDELITAQAEKIEALKAHKKGLMQGLFPSINEVKS